MDTHELSLIVYGHDTSPSARSHWALALHKPSSTTGTLMHVLLLDSSTLFHQFEERSDCNFLTDRLAEGYIHLAALTTAQYVHAKEIIRAKPGPWNGRDRCQDWTAGVVRVLEEFGIMREGLGEWVGRSAVEVERKSGGRWWGV
ncbi:hypothetical protein M011DRAFT_469555 [Sporormia fimetaria CBS 119925]|uniref:Uncharacterized protein n=1 Tax=Sporormia fimetaria CBS 119925 TaxID=1340428 RepID=A0A6A6V857_9PLEO|nr:hypothetical protein M011DRAFT_469555 [Sporormia fimetaria CBS 119925]